MLAAQRGSVPAVSDKCNTIKCHDNCLSAISLPVFCSRNHPMHQSCQPEKRHLHDVLIVGSGAAGMTLALKLPDSLSVAVICKGSMAEGATWLAQGGVAAVLDEYDSIESHISDTLAAGAGLCRREAVSRAVKHSASAIEWLVSLGAEFDTRQGKDGAREFDLTREGGHSHRRVIHAADTTGREIATRLSSALRERPNIRLFEQRVSIDLISSRHTGTGGSRCFGAYVLSTETGQVELQLARFVVLATGGASKVYLYTSNPDTASGDGIAMAWRAGCRVANMEFNQFHPTCLYHPHARSFLITEAIRGEGGRLLLPNGETFMEKFDARCELAPRDIVARAIDHEMKRLGCDCVYLDISHRSPGFIKKHFPAILEKCLSLGINMLKQPIPVVPAAHYTCGGIVTGLSGQTDVERLYAVGEASCTGVHGANRMASNSLLECVVFGDAAARSIAACSLQQERDGTLAGLLESLPDWDASRVTDSDEDIIVAHNWDELRRSMWDYVGIVRSNRRLERAEHRVRRLQKEVAEFYSNYSVSGDLIELRNLILVASLIIASARQRRESRGLHYNLDYPHSLSEAKDTILVPDNCRLAGSREALCWPCEDAGQAVSL